MHKLISVPAVFLLLVGVTSCAIRSRVSPAYPNAGLRTDLEVRLSEIAWDHAECYYAAAPYHFYGPTSLDFQPPTRGAEPKPENTPSRLITQCKTMLLDKLGQNEKTKGMQDYFAKFYPTLGDALLEIPGPTAPPKDQLQVPHLEHTGFQADQGGRAVTDFRFQQIAHWIVVWVAQRLIYTPDSRRFLISLNVDSTPKRQAVITLRHFDSSPADRIPTQGSFGEVYRGLYRYRIERDGYKTFDSGSSDNDPPLNLVDWGWTDKGMVCELVPDSSSLEALPCKLERE